MQQSMQIRRRYARGLSLVELMVAMLLGLILIAGVLQIFLGNRQAQRMEQAISRVEENGRIAMDLITQDLRVAGYYGCARAVEGEINNASLLEVDGVDADVLLATDADAYLSNSVRGFQRTA